MKEEICKALLYLMSCSLNGTAVSEKVLDNIDISELRRVSHNHSVQTLVCMALEKTGIYQQAEAEEKKKWQDAKNRSLRKILLFDAERQAILAELEKIGIWYMPLKGIVLKDLYPAFGMREMADNDILFDEAYREEVKKVFKSRGYETEMYGKSNHDVYQKAPVFNFEMHVSLFYEAAYPDLAAKYASVGDRLRKDENSMFGRHFSPEDFYVYVMAHDYKHYSRSGTGVRTLADLYVMSRKFGPQMDRVYLEQELNSLGILNFERKSVSLAEKVFGGTDPVDVTKLDEEEKELLTYFLGSATYGTIRNRVKNELHKMEGEGEKISTRSKVRYIVGRVFPGLKWCRENYPVIYKYPVLLPFFWIWRILFRGILGVRKHIGEWKAIKNAE